MWKFFSLSVILIITQAADIQDLYGDWILVAYYPVSTSSSSKASCFHFEFSKNPEDVQCTLSDGTNVTSVQMDVRVPTSPIVVDRHFIPFMAVDEATDVTPALNLTCKCGDVEKKNQGVVRIVNEDYLIMYHNLPPSRESSRTELEPNEAKLFVRKVMSRRKLLNVMASIDELKQRNGAIACTTENYGVVNQNGV